MNGSSKFIFLVLFLCSGLTCHVSSAQFFKKTSLSTSYNGAYIFASSPAISRLTDQMKIVDNFNSSILFQSGTFWEKSSFFRSSSVEFNDYGLIYLHFEHKKLPWRLSPLIGFVTRQERETHHNPDINVIQDTSAVRFDFRYNGAVLGLNTDLRCPVFLKRLNAIVGIDLKINLMFANSGTRTIYNSDTISIYSPTPYESINRQNSSLKNIAEFYGSVEAGLLYQLSKRLDVYAKKSIGFYTDTRFDFPDFYDFDSNEIGLTYYFEKRDFKDKKMHSTVFGEKAN